MKRFMALLLAVAVLFTTLSMVAFSEEQKLEITLKINQEYKTYDPEMILVTIERANYQVLAPARPFLEDLGATVEWIDESQSVVCTKDDRTVTYVIGAETATANGEEEAIPTPAQLVDGTAFIPVEFTAATLNYRIIREEYGRFIRVVSRPPTQSPKFDRPLKPGLAPLVSTIHRDVATEFEKSNRLDDLYYFTDTEYIPTEELKKQREIDPSMLPSGEVVFTQDDLLEQVPEPSASDLEYGTWSIETIEGDEEINSNRVLRIQCWKAPDNQTFFICKPQKRFKEYVHIDDKILVKFKIRLVAGGHVDTGAGKCFVHVEEDYIPRWYKTVEETVEFGDEWREVYAIGTGVENANAIGFSIGFWPQTVEIADWEIQMLDRDADISAWKEYKKDVDFISAEISKDAPWRQEAIDRIEEVRKGDFKVVVKDKDGNPVPNAEVELDMFEHEVKWGAVMDSPFRLTELQGKVDDYIKNIAKDCNATGCGNAQKIAYTSANINIARRKFADVKAQGIKYFRGHAVWMPLLTEGDSRPYILHGLGQSANLEWADFEEYVKSHINKLVWAMPEIYEWDVSNEMTNRVTFDNVYGKDYLYKIYEWCKEVFPEGMELALCDNQIPNANYWKKLDEFQRDGVYYDVLAYQGHNFDVVNDPHYGGRSLMDTAEAFDRYTYEYGKQFSISEFTIYAETQELQADFLRDYLILCFSHPGFNAFNMFWYSDYYTGAKSTAGNTPLYDENFNKKLGWYVWQDLLYNKWWTKDAKATTDADGRGTVNGFYGDYDITVSINGEVVKTEMAAFHRGYENELVITLD